MNYVHYFTWEARNDQQLLLGFQAKGQSCPIDGEFTVSPFAHACLGEDAPECSHGLYTLDVKIWIYHLFGALRFPFRRRGSGTIVKGGSNYNILFHETTDNIIGFHYQLFQDWIDQLRSSLCRQDSSC